MSIKKLEIGYYAFELHRNGNGEIVLSVDKPEAFDHSFEITFKDEKELDKFVQFLKSPIERMWNE